MILSHVSVWSRDAPISQGIHGALIGQFANMAAPTFALLMGLSVGLVAQRPGVRTGQLVRRDWVRGLIYIALGLLLQQLGTFIAVVLQFLGASLIVGTVVGRLRTRWLVPLTLALTAVGPLINRWAQANFVRDTGWFTEYPLWWFALSPTYQMTTILPIFFAGVLLARQRLSVRSLVVLAGAGVLAFVGYALLHLSGTDQTGPGTYYDFFGNIARSFIGSAVLIFVGDRLGTVGRRLVSPLTAMGSLSLSAYVLQVCLFALLIRGVDPMRMRADWWIGYVVVLSVVLVFSWVWQRLWGRGPLERAMRLVTTRVP